MLSDRSEESKVAHGNDNPLTKSLWHCLELCRLYTDCNWVSWKISGDVEKGKIFTWHL